MTKDEALERILSCSTEYANNLSGRNLLFAYGGKDKKVNILETTFSASNYLHLTGVKFQSGHKINASFFFHMCIDRRLKLSDFEMAPDGTTTLKLSVLPFLVKPHLSAKMLGQFNQQSISLYTDKLVGSSNKGCMGFTKADSGFYVPNTVLNVDIRDVTASPQMRILFTLSKHIRDEKYNSVEYISPKGWDDFVIPTDVSKKIGVVLEE